MENPETPTTWCGLRRSAVVEVGLYLGAALVIDFVFLGGQRFWDVSPHPFWPIVLLVSAQYGTSEGLFAALASTVALLLGRLPQQNITQDDYDYLFFVIRNPMMWLLASVVWGELRVRHRGVADGLKRELDSVRNKAEELGAAYTRMSQLKEKLDLRVAGQLRTAIRMYEAARTIERLEPEEVVGGVSKIVRVVMNPEQFSLFLLNGEALETAAENGWRPGDGYLRRLGAGTRLYQEVIGRQRFLCSASAEDNGILAGQGVLAGPLISAGSGQVVGMLKIEKLSFLDLNLTSVQTFKVLCEWIATAYANALRYKAVCAENVVDESTSLFSYSFFGRQAAFLCDLAHRVGFDVTMVVLRLENGNELSDEERGRAPAIVSEAVRAALRKTDMAFDYRREGAEYSIILPNTPVESAEIVSGKLLSRLNGGAARFTIDVQILYRHELKRGHGAEAHDSIDSETRMAPARLLGWYTQYMEALSRRIGFPMSYVVLRPADATLLDAEQRALLSTVVETVVARCVREGDLVFDCSGEAIEYRLLLPGASAAGAAAIAATAVEKINAALAMEGAGFTIGGGLEASAAPGEPEAMLA